MRIVPDSSGWPHILKLGHDWTGGVEECSNCGGARQTVWETECVKGSNMVNTANQIDGLDIGQHPLAGGEMPVMRVFVGEKEFLAVLAIVGGVIVSREGTKRFNAGDYIITDDPPTNAWRVNPEAFRATYRPIDQKMPPHTVPGPAAPDLAARAADKTAVNQKAAAVEKPKMRGKGPGIRAPGAPAPKSVPGRSMVPKRKGAIKKPAQ